MQYLPHRCKCGRHVQASVKSIIYEEYHVAVPIAAFRCDCGAIFADSEMRRDNDKNFTAALKARKGIYA